MNNNNSKARIILVLFFISETVYKDCINIPGYIYFYFRGSTLKILQIIGFGKKKICGFDLFGSA